MRFKWLKTLGKTLVLSLAATALFTSVNTKAEDTNTVAEIPVGEGENAVTYTKYSACPEGPQDFYVYKDRAYLLDSENYRILVYDGITFEQCIDLGTYCNMMEIIDDEIYALAYVQKKILKFNIEGELLESYPLGCDSSRVKAIVKDKDVMIINSAGQKMQYVDSYSGFGKVYGDIKLADSVSEKNPLEEPKEYRIGEVEIQEYFTNISGDYAVFHRYNTQLGHVIGDEFIVQLQGEEIKGYHKMDLDSWVVIPKRYFRVINEQPYLMNCYKDRVVIEKVIFEDTLQNSFWDNIESIQEEVKARNESMKKLKQERDEKNTKAANKISLSRSEVISRAESMRSYYWVLNAKHKVVRESTLLPKAVQDAPVGQSFQGIPYCWGGFFGLSDTSSVGSYGGKFSDKITTVFSDGTMYMAGNVKSKDSSGKRQGHISETIGLDCSGFISSAYGLTRKESTVTLKDTRNFYEVANLKNLQAGDILVSSEEGHVYLYTGRNGTNYVVYDCNSSKDTGKVLKREITEEHIQKFNYVGRTPWAN